MGRRKILMMNFFKLESGGCFSNVAWIGNHGCNPTTRTLKYFLKDK